MRCRRALCVLVGSKTCAAGTAAAAAPYGLSAAQRKFHSQHRTPIVPQVHVAEPEAPPLSSTKAVPTVNVGYLLHRNQVVKHTPHPLEMEMSYLLEREHQRYSRHETTESATHFLAARGQPMDLLGRTDPNQIKGNFFGLELYQDAMRVVLQRYSPEKRVAEADLWNPAELSTKPPKRHTLQRCLDDFLYLLIQDECGKWTIPQTQRKATETLRMTVDRAVSTHHADGLDVYVWSNAPQATTMFEEELTRLFIFSATYISGRPQFTAVEPLPRDHAWVTRREMLQYSEDFKSVELLRALMDISSDGVFEE